MWNSSLPSYCDPERIGMNKTLKAFSTETCTKRNGYEVVHEVSLRSMAAEMESIYKEVICNDLINHYKLRLCLNKPA